MSKTIVSLMNVEKWYGDNHVVKNMNVNIAEGEFLTLLGIRLTVKDIPALHLAKRTVFMLCSIGIIRMYLNT